MLIFYINGYAQSGKDSFVDYVSKYCKSYSVSTIDNVKTICRREFGWDGVKDARGRKLLAAVKQAWADYNDGTVITMKQDIDTHQDLKADILFIHVREIEQIQRMQRLYGGRTVEVVRYDVEYNATENAFLKQQKGCTYDHVVYNTSTLDDLSAAAKAFVSQYL